MPVRMTPKRSASVSSPWWARTDRKSTRLNSSHLVISYAVFCLKKKRLSHRTPGLSKCLRHVMEQAAAIGSCFFFNDTATTEIYTLSLHDALPISPRPGGPGARRRGDVQRDPSCPARDRPRGRG